MNANINGTLDDVTICPIRSRYTDGAWSQVRATFHWHFDAPVTEREVRAAMAAAHRTAANLLDATQPSGSWCLPEVVLVGGYANVVQTSISIELADGSKSERDALLELFHDVIPPPEA